MKQLLLPVLLLSSLAEAHTAQADPRNQATGALPEVERCQAKSLEWPGRGQVTIVLCPGADLSVFTRDKRRVERPVAVWANRACKALDKAMAKFDSSTGDDNDPYSQVYQYEGMTEIQSIGSPRRDSRNKRLEMEIPMRWEGPCVEGVDDADECQKRVVASLSAGKRGFYFTVPAGFHDTLCGHVAR